MRYVDSKRTSRMAKILKNSLPCVMCVTLAAPASIAVAGTNDGALGRTRYVQSAGDINGDGLSDVLMKAMPSVLMLPLEDDLNVPVSIAPPSPTFALLSNPYGQYSLVTDPDAGVIANGAWKAGTQTITFSGASGDLAGSVSISAVAANQTSFVVSMASSGKLQIANVSLPLPTCD